MRKKPKYKNLRAATFAWQIRNDYTISHEYMAQLMHQMPGVVKKGRYWIVERPDQVLLRLSHYKKKAVR